MSTGRWTDMEDVVHTYNEILLTHKNSEIMPPAPPWMDLRDYHIKWSKSEEDKYNMLICGI